MNFSINKFYELYGDIYTICIQLHDAMYVYSKIGEREQTMQRMRECMIRPLQANGQEFFIDVDYSAGPTWGDLEEL